MTETSETKQDPRAVLAEAVMVTLLSSESYEDVRDQARDIAGDVLEVLRMENPFELEDLARAMFIDPPGTERGAAAWLYKAWRRGRLAKPETDDTRYGVEWRVLDQDKWTGFAETYGSVMDAEQSIERDKRVLVDALQYQIIEVTRRVVG